MIEMEMTKDLKEILAIEVEHVSKSAPVCPFLIGEPGIGKSSIIRALCEEKGWHYFELLCNQLGDRSDLTGCRSVKEQVTSPDGSVKEIWKQIFFPHQAVQDAITCAHDNPNDIVVLFLDEINRTSSDITSAILSFTTARKIGTYEFPSNIRFIVAGNDNGNVTALDSASISRFVKYKVKPSAQTYMDIESNLNPYIEQVLKSHPEYVLCKGMSLVTTTVSNGDDDDTFESEYQAFDDDASGYEQFTTPRTLSGLNAFLNKCDLSKLSYFTSVMARDSETGQDTSLLQTIIQGHVGSTAFANELTALIAADVQRGSLNKASSVSAPVKPKVYNQIMRCTDIQTRDQMIASLDDRSKSEILLYAVWEKNTDNSDLIRAVATNYNGMVLVSDIQQQFSKLKALDELDEDNYTALIQSGTQLGNMIVQLLGD